MELVITLVDLIKLFPGWLAFIISISTILFAGWTFYKKSANETDTTNSHIHETQVSVLMAQVRMLSDDLNAARIQLAAIHQQNMDLLVQLTQANLKIKELETVINKLSNGS